MKGFSLSRWSRSFLLFFFFNDTATTEIYTLSLHDALPIWEYTSQPYSWVATIEHPEGRQLPAMISDVSYEAAEMALRLGDLDVARWAAEIGHAVTPESDRPLCQLLLIAKAAGQIEVAKGLVDQILSVNDAAGPEECPPWALAAIR